MNPQHYLNRIGIKRSGPPDLEYLMEIQAQHLLHVPFENVAVLSREPVSLKEKQLYEKIVVQRRGGFCFELNGLFHWLLTQLGYRVTFVAAGVYQAEREQFGPPFDHMALLVHLDRTYLVDVGFGDSARMPVAIPAGKIDDLSGRYRIQREAAENDTFQLQQHKDGAWHPQYEFTTQPRKLIEYEPMCEYHSTSPNSSFTQKMICTLATTTGRITLSSSSFTITDRYDKHIIPIVSASQRERILRDHFAIAFAQFPPPVSAEPG